VPGVAQTDVGPDVKPQRCDFRKHCRVPDAALKRIEVGDVDVTQAKPLAQTSGEVDRPFERAEDAGYRTIARPVAATGMHDLAAKDVENSDDAERQRSKNLGSAMRVLIHEWVTGGGLAGEALPESWAREGFAMRRAVADDFRALEGVEVLTTLDARFRAEDHERATVLVRKGEEEAILGQLAAGCDYTVLIAPETDCILERRAAHVEQSGGRTLGASPAAIALTTNKLRLASHLASAGVATPPVAWFDPRSRHPPAFGFPAVIKPVDGAGSLDTWLVRSAHDVPVLEPTERKWIVQPFIEGAAMSASYLVAPDGESHLLGVGRQFMDLRRRRFVYEGGRIPGPVELGLSEPLRAVRCVPGLRGYVGVDFIVDEALGGITIIEINPRVTTSFVGWQRLLRAGTIARYWLDSFGSAGSPEKARSWGNDKLGPVRFLPDGTLVDETGDSA
jgi:predicted ATP-grasp superfamily ATP-dependent carboligase